MQIIRKSSFATSPWKNGGGVTHEAIRVPAGEGAFRWRVSVAEIRASGPFSDFAGYDRFMVLLRGAGVRLTFDGREHTELRNPGDLARFDGAASTSCALLGGECTDLNLIVAQSIKGTRAWTTRLGKPYPVNPGRGTLLVFAIDGTVSLDGAHGAPESLAPGDLAVSSRESVLVSPAAPAAAAVARAGSPGVLVFFAAVDDNSA